MAKDKNSVPLPLELEDEEEIVLGYGFNLSLEFSAGFGAILRSVNYAILKDFCALYELEPLAVLALYKQMIAEMEA